MKTFNGFLYIHNSITVVNKEFVKYLATQKGEELISLIVLRNWDKIDELYEQFIKTTKYIKMKTFKQRSKRSLEVILAFIICCTFPLWLIIWWITGYNIIKYIEKTLNQ